MKKFAIAKFLVMALVLGGGLIYGTQLVQKNTENRSKAFATRCIAGSVVCNVIGQLVTCSDGAQVFTNCGGGTHCDATAKACVADDCKTRTASAKNGKYLCSSIDHGYSATLCTNGSFGPIIICDEFTKCNETQGCLNNKTPTKTPTKKECTSIDGGVCIDKSNGINKIKGGKSPTKCEDFDAYVTGDCVCTKYITNSNMLPCITKNDTPKKDTPVNDTPKKDTPVNGSCNNSSKYLCYSGIPVSTREDNIAYRWSCAGKNGGSQTPCQLNKPDKCGSGKNECDGGHFDANGLKTDGNFTYWKCGDKYCQIENSAKCGSTTDYGKCAGGKWYEVINPVTKKSDPNVWKCGTLTCKLATPVSTCLGTSCYTTPVKGRIPTSCSEYGNRTNYVKALGTCVNGGICCLKK
ncbi:MAG: hypothetical protein WCG91_04460 [Candidatus Shapirobacteria bacterium]